MKPRPPDHDEWGDPKPGFGAPIFRVTSHAITVKLSDAQWVTITQYENVILYLDEDGKIVQTVITYGGDEDTGDPPV